MLKSISFLWWSVLYFLSSLYYPDKCPEWHSRAITLLHGTVTTVVGLDQCKVWTLSIQDLTSKCTPDHYALMVWSWGYFAFDFLWCLVYWSDSILILFHHISALVSIAIYMDKYYTGCTFACTIALMEITNPLLQIRWFLRSVGYDKTIIFKIVEVTYLVMFLTMRGVIGSYVLFRILPSEYFDNDEKAICVVLYLVSIALIVEIMGFVFYKYKDFTDKCQVLLDRYGILLINFE